MYDIISNIIKDQIILINSYFNILLRDDFDLKRIAATYLALLKMGVRINNQKKQKFFDIVNDKQHKDGGFTELRETLIILEIFYEENKDYKNVMKWIYSLIDKNGGIRSYERDRVRMPDTAITFSLLKKLDIENPYEEYMINYINETWKKELYLQGGLTYKAGRFLSAYSFYPVEKRREIESLYKDTIKFLKDHQHSDGGFSTNIRDKLESMPLYSSIVYKGLKDSFVLEQEDYIEQMLNLLINYLYNTSQPGEGWSEHERDYVSSIIIYNLLEGGKRDARRYV